MEVVEQVLHLDALKTNMHKLHIKLDFFLPLNEAIEKSNLA